MPTHGPHYLEIFLEFIVVQSYVAVRGQSLQADEAATQHDRAQARHLLQTKTGRETL